MLIWNPSWLKEAAKANDPPPVVVRPQPIEDLKPFYDFFFEYHEIMHSPILFEMWESVKKGFQNNNNSSFNQKLVMTGIETVADDERLWKINCEYLCVDSPSVVIPKEGDFVQVEVPTRQPESATHSSFAYVNASDRIRIRKETRLHPSLTAMYGKYAWVGGKQTASRVKLGIIIRKYNNNNNNQMSVDVIKLLPCRVLCSLISSIRQYDGLVASPRSPLLPHILKPHDPEVFLPSLPPTPFKTTAADSDYNPSQAKAIQSSVNAMFQSAPKILLLQGPPGTGKSHTVGCQ